ncbi:hypothetical protein VKT23_015140 [Stygiomarasmius scandens]|uniref:Uncharacterized protein n=1 Tax=Marasmiellus scandens TaxID=2682957 RepID=A0ABR1IYN2_9AGAR
MGMMISCIFRRSVKVEPVRPPSARPPSAPYSRPPSQGRSKTPVPRNSEIFPTDYSSPESIHPIMLSQHDENEVPHLPPLYRAPDVRPTFGKSIDSISTDARHPEVVTVTTPFQEETRLDTGSNESRG